MMLDAFNPSHDDLMTLNERLLWANGDIWKTDSDGVPHRFCSMYGELFTVKLPDNVPLKYKGKKARRAIIFCNSCELVTGFEIYYTGGNVLVFDNPESTEYRVIRR